MSKKSKRSIGNIFLTLVVIVLGFWVGTKIPPVRDWFPRS